MEWVFDDISCANLNTSNIVLLEELKVSQWIKNFLALAGSKSQKNSICVLTK